jgi:orotate phosphoribosyltransferase
VVSDYGGSLDSRADQAMTARSQSFIDLALAERALRFGTFTLKSGRRSPYFFDSGLFNHGASLARLGRLYAEAICGSGIAFDMLFGPAYKGIPLVTAGAIALAEHHSLDVPYAFDRKEPKDHGEGGTVVGAPLRGRVLVVDDVITAGTSVRESVRVICDAGAKPCGVVVALDRQERGLSGCSAVQEVAATYRVPVVAIATLDDLIAFLERTPGQAVAAETLKDHRARHGLGP